MKITIMILSMMICSCGSAEFVTLPSLAARQPSVVSVDPQDGAEVGSLSSIVVNFSRAVDPASINRYSFIIVEDYEDMTPQIVKGLLDDGGLVGLDGSQEVAENGMSAAFTPVVPFRNGIRYGIVIGTSVYTSERLPFNQTPGSESTPFVSSFTVGNSGNSGNSDIVATAPTAEDVSADSVEIAAPSIVRPDEIFINEIYYDVSGTDTNGDVFVELWGTPETSIGGYKAVFVNGDDGRITETVTLPSGAVIPVDGFYVIADAVTGLPSATHVANADYIENFDPQNGPDSVQLQDDSGRLKDVVCYGPVTLTLAENGLAMCGDSSAPDAPSGESISRGEGRGSFTVNSAPSPGE